MRPSGAHGFFVGRFGGAGGLVEAACRKGRRPRRVAACGWGRHAPLDCASRERSPTGDGALSLYLPLKSGELGWDRPPSFARRLQRCGASRAGGAREDPNQGQPRQGQPASPFAVHHPDPLRLTSSSNPGGGSDDGYRMIEKHGSSPRETGLKALPSHHRAMGKI